MRVQIVIVVLLLGSFVVRLDACCFRKKLQKIDLRNEKAAALTARPRCSCLVYACEQGDFEVFAQRYQACLFCDKVPLGYDHRLRELWIEYNKLSRQDAPLRQREECAEKMKVFLLERSGVDYPDYAKGFFDLMSIGFFPLIRSFWDVGDWPMVYFLFDKWKPELIGREIKEIGEILQQGPMPREWLVSLGTEKPNPAALLALCYINHSGISCWRCTEKPQRIPFSLKKLALAAVAANQDLLPVNQKKEKPKNDRTRDSWTAII